MPAGIHGLFNAQQRETNMSSNNLRWMAAVVCLMLAPLPALATGSNTASVAGSTGLMVSLVVVLGLVALASAGASVLSWYASRQCARRLSRVVVGAEGGRVVPLRPVLQVVTPALVSATPTAAAPSGRRAQAMRRRHPGLTAVRGVGQPGQVTSQFGHLN